MNKLAALSTMLCLAMTACPPADPKVRTVQLPCGLTASVLEVQGDQVVLKAKATSHLLFSTDEGLCYAHTNGQDWGFKRTWDFGSDYGRTFDMCVDENDKVYISCSLNDFNDEDLGYVNNVKGVWITSTACAREASSVGMSSKIAVDADGDSYIAHRRWNDSALLCTSNDQSPFWQTEKLLDNAVPTAMIADSLGRVHLFSGATHLKKEAGQWQQEQMPIVGYGFAVSSDSSGNLFLLTEQGLWILTAGGNWQGGQGFFSQILPSVPSSSVKFSRNALAIDAAGNYHVAFVVEERVNEVDTIELYYASDFSGSWQTMVIDASSSGDYGNYPALQVLNSGRIAYAYEANDGIYYVEFNPF